MSTFSNFAFDEKILKILEEIGYKTPTSIQDLAIPHVLKGSDLIASAQTGTGKTAAFMLPILQQLIEKQLYNASGPHVLILVPTRELAIQISDEAKRYTKYLPQIKTVCVYGGVPYPIQKRALSKRYDILVATPGRLIDHMDQGFVNLSKLKLLVLDEADRMIDMGFIEPIEQIINQTPKTRQTLLFSATIDNKILPFSRKFQKNPFEIKLESKHSQEVNIDQQLYYVDNLNHKINILEHLVTNTEMKQTIIFTGTKYQANVLARHLFEKGHASSALHGDMNQRQRTKTIDKMRKGNIDILVATDVAARGIDISTISHVINFDLPRNPEDFIHRIGRTGRAGASGTAITFASHSEKRWLVQINNLIKSPMTLLTVTGLEPKMKEGDRGSSGGGSRGGSSRGGPGGQHRHPGKGKPNNIKKPFHRRQKSKPY